MILNPVINYELNKFFLLFIPNMISDNLPVFLGSLLLTTIPYAPVNLIIFSVIFVVIYLTDIFGWASYKECKCEFNRPSKEKVFSIWTCIKSTYMIYFLVAYVINYNTLNRYSLRQVHAI